MSILVLILIPQHSVAPMAAMILFERFPNSIYWFIHYWDTTLCWFE